MSKKILSMLLVLTMLVGALAIMPISINAVETITIEDESDWLELCGTNVDGKNVIVTATKLDFSKDTVTPIEFSNGTFDGQGVVITGVNMDLGGDAALFCSVSGATIKNIVIDDSSFTVKKENGGDGNWVAAVACCANTSTFENIYVKEGVYLYSEYGYAGGIVGGITSGNNTVTIRSCIYAGTMEAAETAKDGGCGGIIGNSNSAKTKQHNVTIEYCLVTGRVPNNVNKSSGFIGTVENGTSKPKATLTSCIYAGGAEDDYFFNRPFGHASVFEVTNCYTTHTAANGVYNNVKYTAEGSGVSLVERSSLEGLDAIDVTGFKKMAGGIMIPTGIANYLYPVVDGQITFKNWDGTVLQTGMCEGGIMPEYTGATPTKPDTKFYTYEFDGWTPVVDIVNGAAEYVATFKETFKTEAPAEVNGEYVISNIYQWFYLINNTAEFDGETLVLGADLDFTGADEFIEPISGFKGTLDGKGYAIKNVYMSGKGDIALFDDLGDNATVKNLVIKASTFEIAGNGNWLGTVACCTNGKNVTISNIYVDKDVKVVAGKKDGNSIAAGILGGVYGSGAVVTITDCVFAGLVKGTGNYVAGIVADAEAGNTTLVSNCINVGYVISETNYAAGIAVSGGITIENCVNAGKVYGKNYVGGIYVGNPTNDVVITNCYTVGNIEAHNTAKGGTVTAEGCFENLGLNQLTGLQAKVPATFTKRYGDFAMPTACTGVSGIHAGLTLLDGASVRLSTPTGLRFTAVLGAAYLDSFKGEGKEVSFGILITPIDYVEAAGEFTVEALDALGHSVNYKEINADNYVNDPDNDGSYVFTGVLASVQEGNYTRSFAARAYIKVVENGVATYYYSDYDAKLNARSIAEVAEAAYKDTNPVETEHYKYALDIDVEEEVEGTITTVTKTVYSPYTIEQRETLLGFTELGEQ